MGGEAIRDLLRNLDLEILCARLREDMIETNSEAKRKKFAKRLKVCEAIRDSDNRPEWLMLEVILFFHRTFVRWFHWMVAASHF